MCVRKFRLARNTHVLTRDQEKAIHAKKKVKGIKKGDLRNKTSGKTRLYDVKSKEFVSVDDAKVVSSKIMNNGAKMEMLVLPDGRKLPRIVSMKGEGRSY